LPDRYSHVQAVGHRLLLSRGEQGQPVESDVWVSDGTEAGTVPLASLVPDLQDFKAEQALGDPQMTVAGDAAYFFGHVGDGDPGVWRTDGTAAGTRLVHTSARGTRLNPAGVVDGLLYFATGTQLFPTGSQLWRTDGTDAGTVLVQDMAAGSLTPAGGAILFAGFDLAHGWELWAMPRDVTEVYVRGTAWANSFKSYLQDHDLGADGYGYRVNGKQPPGVLPWVNLDQVVVRVPLDRIEGMPSPGNLSITSQRGGPAYTVTAVNPVPGDPQAFVFLLNRPLGGTDADATRNGDHLTLTMPGLGPQGTNLVLPLDVLQGDVDGSGVVLADDFSAVKKKFFRFVGGPAGGSDAAVNYSPFHDVDGSGAILANDFSEVKKRFFQAFPATPAAPAGIAASFARRRPLGQPLFGAQPVLG
jgi:ELWxxDGT repeat protein